MSISHPHDPRTFRQFAKLNADGSIAATVLIADGAPDPVDSAKSVYADVTEHYGTSLASVKIDPALVGAIAATADAVDLHQANLVAAELAHDAAKESLTQALAKSITASTKPATSIDPAPLPVVVK